MSLQNDDLEFTWGREDEPQRTPPRPPVNRPTTKPNLLMWLPLVVALLTIPSCSAYTMGRAEGVRLAQDAVDEAKVSIELSKQAIDEASYWKFQAEEASVAVSTLSRELSETIAAAELYKLRSEQDSATLDAALATAEGRGTE